MNTLKRIVEKEEEKEEVALKQINQANGLFIFIFSYQDLFRRRHLGAEDDLITSDLSLSWMSGFDEVEEWLRQRTLLLQSLQVRTTDVISMYMRQPTRSVDMHIPLKYS